MKTNTGEKLKGGERERERETDSALINIKLKPVHWDFINSSQTGLITFVLISLRVNVIFKLTTMSKLSVGRLAL